MKEFVLRDPDGGIHVTGDGGERSRLLAAGYVETDKAALKAADSDQVPAQEPKTADRPLAPKTETKTPPKP